MTARIIVIVLLLLVMASLAAGMVFLVRDKGRGGRSTKALLVRAVLSTVVLLALALIWALGALDAPPGG